MNIPALRYAIFFIVLILALVEVWTLYVIIEGNYALLIQKVITQATFNQIIISEGWMPFANAAFTLIASFLFLLKLDIGKRAIQVSMVFNIVEVILAFNRTSAGISYYKSILCIDAFLILVYVVVLFLITKLYSRLY